MEKELEKIRKIKKKVEADLLKRPGVIAVSVGFKVVKGKKTKELAIKVHVEEKKDVPNKEKVPKEIEGVKTDVVQRKYVPHMQLQRMLDLAPRIDTTRYANLVGGMSIGPCRSIWLAPPDVTAAGWYLMSGTLGAVVFDVDSGDPMMLSNFHVLAVDAGWAAGDNVSQPSRGDGGACPADSVGTLQRAVLAGSTDGAVATIDTTVRSYSCQILDIGNVGGSATVSIGDAVRKRGRTTELTHGTVDDIDVTVTVPYPAGIGDVTLTDQIIIETDTAQNASFGRSGDSGSMLVTENNRIAGLYFAGTTEETAPDGTVIQAEGHFGVVNPIGDVLTDLNIRLCLPMEVKHVKEWKEWKEYKEPKEFKEFKEPKELKEMKELKEKEFEPKELKEFKEPKGFKEKEKDIYEGKLIRETGVDRDLPFIGRMERLEAMVERLTHFINSSLRPNLDSSSLKDESDQK